MDLSSMKAPFMEKQVLSDCLCTSALTVSAAEHAPKAAELGESKEPIHKTDEFSKRSENVIVSPISSSPAPFTFGAPTGLSLNNGLSASTTSLFSAPNVPSNASKGLVTSLGTSGATTVVAPTAITNPSNIATTNNSPSTLPATTAAPFQFGLGSITAVVPSSSTSLPLPSSGSEDKDLECKAKQPPPFGSLSSNGDTPSFTSPGNGGIFGFHASGAANPFANNKSQTPNPFASATGSSVFSDRTIF